jgi:hypothetical protein
MHIHLCTVLTEVHIPCLIICLKDTGIEYGLCPLSCCLLLLVRLLSLFDQHAAIDHTHTQAVSVIWAFLVASQCLIGKLPCHTDICHRPHAHAERECNMDLPEALIA